MPELTFNEAQERLFLEDGVRLRELMRHEGWPIMAKLFKMSVEAYDSTKGIKTLKELLARQDAIAMMNMWMEMVVQRVEKVKFRESIDLKKKEYRLKNGLVVLPEENKVS